MTGSSGERGLKALAIVALGSMALAGCTTAEYKTVSALEALTDADRTVMSETFQQALESSKVGESRNWANSDTGHAGTVMPTRTYEAGSGAPCREYQQTVTVDGATEVVFGAACRQADGRWEVTDTPVLMGAYGKRGRSYRYPYYAYRPFYGYPYYWRPYRRYGFGYYPYGHGFHFGFGHHFGHRHYYY